MRRDLDDILCLADRLDAAGERGLLATLVAARGSSYRPLGSMMLSGPPGMPRAGGVSGGCLEEYIARHGRELLATQPAALLGFDTSRDGDLSDARPTLGCGGHVDVLIERLTPRHRALLRALRDACVAGPTTTATCTVTVGRCASHATGDLTELTVAWQLAVGRADERDHLIPSPNSFRVTIQADAQPRLVVCGAGNDVQPLAQLASLTDWSVTVADRRARLATRARFPTADRVHDGDWETLLTRDVVRPGDYVVLMTHDLADDIEICRAIGSLALPYVGVLGPAHRLDWLRDALRGTCPDAFVDALRGPIGLDLGGRAPEQIALSIAAELATHRFGRDGRPLAAPEIPPRLAHAAPERAR